MTDLTVANEIHRQLGGRVFDVMTGAKAFFGTDNSLSFKIGGGARQRINSVTVTLTPMDLYTVEFCRIGRVNGVPTRTVVEKHEGIYNDSLTDLFTRVTGFDTKL